MASPSSFSPSSPLRDPFSSPSKSSPGRRFIGPTEFASPERRGLEEVMKKASTLIPFAAHGETKLWKEPPATPRKVMRRQPVRETFNPLPTGPSPYKILCEGAKQGSITIGDQEVGLTLLSQKGSFKDVYTLKALRPIVVGVPNEELVVKVFNEFQCGSSDKNLEKMDRSIIATYKKAKSMGLNMAEIYNADSAVNDKFIIQKKIPHQVDIQNLSHIAQIGHFFKRSLEEKVPLDLVPVNFGVNESDQVVLFDSGEKTQENLGYYIQYGITGWLKLFVKDQGRQVAESRLADFTKDLIPFGYDLQWNQEILDANYINFGNL